MAENEEFNFDFDPDNIPDTNTFWNGLDAYWHANRQFPQGTDQKLSKKADLIDGKIPSSQLPSYVDDVLEFNSFGDLPNPGEQGKIYVTTDKSSILRWNGSEYIRLNADENLMTINTNQSVFGVKEFFTSGGNSYSNTNLRLTSNSGNNAVLGFNKFDSGVGTIQFDGHTYTFTNNDISDDAPVKSKGFKKTDSNDNYFLTGGGGHLNIHAKEDSYFHSARNFTEGTLISTTVDYSVDYGHQFLLEMKGNMYTENLPLEMKIQGYIYYGTIICTRGYSTYSDLKKITAMNLNGKLCFWFPRLGYWQGFSVKLTIGYGGWENGINMVTAVEDAPDPQGTKRVEILIDTIATQEWVNSQSYSDISNNVTLSDTQIISGQKKFSNSVPLIFKSTDKKSWSVHKPLNHNLIIAPSRTLNGEDWDWNNQITFNDNGTIYSNGIVKNGCDNNSILLAGGGHKAIYDFATSAQLANYLPLSGGTLSGELAINRPNGTSLSNTSPHLRVSASNLDATSFSFFIPQSNVGQLAIGNAFAWGTIELQPFGGDATLRGESIATQNWVTNNYWDKYELGFRGINDNDTRNFSFLTSNGNIAKKINVGGLLVSDKYQDEGRIPTNGSYIKGLIDTSNGISKTYYNGYGAVNIRNNVTEYSEWGANIVGAIIIQFPDLTTYQEFLEISIVDGQFINMFQKLNVQIYGNSISLCKASYINDTDAGDYVNLVRVGINPSGNRCLIINDINTVWNYPQIIVDKFNGGGRDTAIGNWTTELVTDLSAYTIQTNVPITKAVNASNLTAQLQNYYTKNEALNLFVGKNGIETIFDTKTFSSSPIVPNATLGNHAVNLNQADGRYVNMLYDQNIGGIKNFTGAYTQWV